VIHSPTLSSTKFWPGGLGHTCTHAIVYARLLLGLTDHGVHPFMVPLRCAKTHAKLPGVDCGDIGPKHGYNAMDNGYAMTYVLTTFRSMMRYIHFQNFRRINVHLTTPLYRYTTSRPVLTLPPQVRSLHAREDPARQSSRRYRACGCPRCLPPGGGVG
jgi:hypothetical protein